MCFSLHVHNNHQHVVLWHQNMHTDPFCGNILYVPCVCCPMVEAPQTCGGSLITDISMSDTFVCFH